MCVVESDQPVAARIMQGEGVAQTVRTFRRWLASLDLEFQPVALFQVMDAAIEPKQEFKRVLVRNRPSPSISCHDTIAPC
jgi:anti-sigma-K factor RskA